jgi:hypothetical protein
MLKYSLYYSALKVPYPYPVGTYSWIYESKFTPNTDFTDFKIFSKFVLVAKFTFFCNYPDNSIEESWCWKMVFVN